MLLRLTLKIRFIFHFRLGLPIQYIVKARKSSETSGACNIADVNSGGVVPPGVF